MPWTCSKCGFHIKGHALLPVRCICGFVDGLEPKQPEPVAIPTTRDHWYSLHVYPWRVAVWNIEEALQWLIRWEDGIPNVGCKCRQHWQEIRSKLPPRMGSRQEFFEWGVGVHNEVNRLPHLSKPILSYAEAKLANGIGEPIEFGQQLPITEFVAVTSLSFLPKHREVQTRCLDSWRRFGLQIAAVNTPGEIEQLRPLYPQVARWRPSDDQSQFYSWPTQRINALCRAVTDQPFMVINSDIELHGPQQRLLDILHSGKVGVGIRYNYQGQWWHGKREGWGIDAFLMRPEQAATLPDLPFAIGRPMWDYWLPYHFDQHKIAMEWIGEPLFFHAAHPVHWSQEDLQYGRRLLEETYGRKEDWSTLRKRWPFEGG